MQQYNIFSTPDEAVKLNSRFRAVTGADGKLLCGLSSRQIVDVSGRTVAVFDGESDGLRVYRGSIEGVEFTLSTDDNYMYLDGRTIGRLSPPQNVASKVLLSVALLLLVALLVCIAILNAMPEDIYPNFAINDDMGYWGTNGTVEIFGDNPVAPGSSGKYTFVIDNPNDVQLEYTLTLTFTHNGQQSNVPIDYSLEMNGVDIDWTSVEGRHSCSIDGIRFASRSSHLFTLYWDWPFSSGNDGLDSTVGGKGGEYTLHISVVAEVAA